MLSAALCSAVLCVQNTNYPALRTLYETYKKDGFNLIAFPCNQFGGQAPGTSEEERQYAFRKFGFEFEVFVSVVCVCVYVWGVRPSTSAAAIGNVRGYMCV